AHSHLFLFRLRISPVRHGRHGTMHEQGIGHGLQGNDPGYKSFINRGLGHAEDHARLFALGDGESAGVPDLAQGVGAVVAHAGHQEADRAWAELLRYGAEEHIDGRAMSVDRRLVGERYDLALWHTAHAHVVTSWTDQHAARGQQVAVLSLFHLERAAF